MTKKVLAFALGVCMAFAFFCPAAFAAGFPTEDFEAGKASGWLRPGLFKLIYAYDNFRHGPVKFDSFLVLQKGKLVYEKYYNGYDKDTPHYMASVTKSVVSALIGVAIGRGDIGGVDDKVVDYFPEAKTMPSWQESKADMTIEHVLLMKSGILTETEEEWDGFFADDQADSALYAFLLPQKSAPGETWAYESAAPSILLGIIERASGVDALAYARAHLFGPLGMTSVKWETAADGLPFGGFGIDMTPRDMLRFGYLYLQEGNWDGEQIIPAAYVAATKPATKARDGYGYLFWNHAVIPYLGFYEANGAAEQHIIIYPRLDMVIVYTSDSTRLGQWLPKVWDWLAFWR